MEFYSEQDARKIKDPRGHLLILDRSFDLIAPVVHDFFYQTGMADYKDGLGKDGEVKVDNKTVFLNDQDELWCRLRAMHCVEAYEIVNAEVAKIVSSNKTDTEGMSIQDMAELMRKLPKQEEMMKNYKIHMDLLNKVLTSIT